MAHFVAVSVGRSIRRSATLLAHQFLVLDVTRDLCPPAQRKSSQATALKPSLVIHADCLAFDLLRCAAQQSDTFRFVGYGVSPASPYKTATLTLLNGRQVFKVAKG